MERTPKYYFRIRYIFVNTYPPKGLLKSFLLFIAQPWGCMMSIKNFFEQKYMFLSKSTLYYNTYFLIRLPKEKKLSF